MRSDRYAMTIPPERLPHPKVEDVFLKIPYEEKIPFRGSNRIDRVVIEFDPVERETKLVLEGMIFYAGQQISFRWALLKDGQLWEGSYEDVIIGKEWYRIFLPEEIEEICERIGSFGESFLNEYV